MRKIVVRILITSFALQPFALVTPALAKAVEMGYSDPDHLHAPKVVNEVKYQYDANGNLVDDGERVISWNQDNLPTRIEKDGKITEFFYDANGRRIVKRSGQQTLTYVNELYEQLTINNEQSSTKYYFANGNRVAARHASPASEAEQALQLHQDHLGSTVLATNSNSQPLSDSLSYFPYGEQVTGYQLPVTSYRFTGQELDDDLDLYNYNARLYNPTTGSFISADSVGGGNRYAYAANNPMIFTDPTGHYIPEEEEEQDRFFIDQYISQAEEKYSIRFRGNEKYAYEMRTGVNVEFTPATWNRSDVEQVLAALDKMPQWTYEGMNFVMYEAFLFDGAGAGPLGTWFRESPADYGIRLSKGAFNLPNFVERVAVSHETAHYLANKEYYEKENYAFMWYFVEAAREDDVFWGDAFGGSDPSGRVPQGYYLPEDYALTSPSEGWAVFSQIYLTDPSITRREYWENWPNIYRFVSSFYFRNPYPSDE